MIDLNAPRDNNIRQVDHRTIQSIIFKNVKYSLGKKSTNEELPLKHSSEEARWNTSLVTVGDWFSYISYYKVISIEGNNVVLRSTADENGDNEIVIPKENISEEIVNGHVFDNIEKVTRSEMVEKMINAKATVMTVNFRKKIDLSFI